jgi:hypothetical protein
MAVVLAQPSVSAEGSRAHPVLVVAAAAVEWHELT